MGGGGKRRGVLGERSVSDRWASLSSLSSSSVVVVVVVVLLLLLLLLLLLVRWHSFAVFRLVSSHESLQNTIPAPRFRVFRSFRSPVICHLTDLVNFGLAT